MFAIVACSDDDIEVITTSGTIVDGSTQSGLADCGFLLRIEGTLYQPTYLNLEYEQDGLDVFLKVEFLNQISGCNTSGDDISMVRIQQISPSD
ncbi:hypothetical protein [Roseivirga misakiensis]|uniref:hypothetical protein n=1 Tax=Roseivirga misakiensis TaxID=1563681 RepID=UPI00114C889D|nr:hypothetical protein [Roseivirga misakiensis]